MADLTAGIDQNGAITEDTYLTISADDASFNKFTSGLSNLMGTVVHETGHVVGLGHAGRDNGSDYSGQRGIYDSRRWSVMSYTGLGITTVTNKSTGVTDTLSKIEDIQFKAPLCFTSGTRIRLIRNGAKTDVPVEALRVGDVAVTVAGDHRRIRWIGHRTVEPAWHPVPSRHFPVHIRAGAFGLGLPERDLRLSAGHPVLVGADADGEGGVLVPIVCLINGTSVVREPVDTVTYWHVELEAHDILLADGLAAESFLDLGCRAFFVEESDHPLHSPDFVPPGLSGRCRPVVTDGPVVEVERERLAAVSAAELTGQCPWSVFDPVA